MISAIFKPIDTPWGSYSASVILLGLALLAYAISSAAVYLAYRRFKAANGCVSAPRFPSKDPFFGIDRLLGSLRVAKEHKILEWNKQHFDNQGLHTYRIKVLNKEFIVTREPENVKTVLATKFNDYSLGQREKSLGHLLGRGIFTTSGERWAHSRAMIRPNFNRSQVADLDAFENHMQTLLQILPRDGSTVDLQELFFEFTIDSSTEFLFGKGTGALNAHLKGIATSNTDFAYAFNHSQDYVAQRGRLGFLREFGKTKEGEDAIRICHEFVDQFVDEAVQYREKLDAGLVDEKEGKYVFLHELAKQTLDKRRLRDEVLNVLLAGRDTTASLLSNMFFMLAKNPKIYAKLREEIEQTLQGQIPTYEQLRNLKYLKWCMNESLRIHPVVPGNSRLAIADTVLPLGGGPNGTQPVFVPKDAVVVYWPYAMHRRKDIYGPDADEYRPERWETLRPGWEYLPFNGGPRICLGQQYALTEAGYVTVRLVQEFAGLEERDTGEWRENMTLTLCSLNGAQVGLIPA